MVQTLSHFVHPALNYDHVHRVGITFQPTPIIIWAGTHIMTIEQLPISNSKTVLESLKFNNEVQKTFCDLSGHAKNFGFKTIAQTLHDL